MAKAKTEKLTRRLENLLGAETAVQRRERQLKVQALSAAGTLLGIFEECRKQQELSKTDLANQVAIKRSTVSRLLSEEGDANPTLHTIVRLLWGLGLRAEISLFDREPGQNRLIEVRDVRKSTGAS